MDTTKKPVTYYAAVDRGVADHVRGSGAVYGVGRSPRAARRDAHAGAHDANARFDVVTITPDAYAYVLARGGAPSSRLCVSHSGVETVEVES